MSGELKIESKGQMLSVQYSLPHLPVPPLEQTMEKYLQTVRPLLTQDQFANTQKVVNQFVQSPGPELQKKLEERAKEKTNWLSEWWKYVAYLDNRDPVVVNVSPGMVFPQQPFRSKDEQLRFAAKFVAGVLDFKRMIDEQTLPVETLGGKPLCMMQYYQILSACRVPGLQKDTHMVSPPADPDPPRHIIVIHNNHIFSVNVYGSKGKPLGVEQLYRLLKKVTDRSRKMAPPVGLLTSLDRDTWASVYEDMVKDKKNKTAFTEIQRGIFVLCLDKTITSGSNQPVERSAIAAEMLHGGGMENNSGNRWFDKTIQFILGADGACGLNYEHTTAEGPPIAAIMDHVLDYVVKPAKDDEPPNEVVWSPHHLEFSLTPKATQALHKAEQGILKLSQDVQLTVFTFDEYGKDFIKRCRLSPDAFIQVALQLTYYRFYDRPCATYETASLRRFQHGRTDTIRSCSMDSNLFTRGMANTSMSNALKISLLKQAIKSHRKYTDEAISGQGVDRHLLGLKLASLESGGGVPYLHKDFAFTESTSFRLSTSQVGAKHDSVMCFGPVVPDGYGCCYNPQNNHINFAVSAFTHCPDTDSDKFSNTLRQSLLDMRDLLDSEQPQSKL